MKVLLAIALALSLSSCGKFEQLEAHYTGWAKMCIDGVTYIQFTSGATPQYTIDGRLVPCTK